MRDGFLGIAGSLVVALAVSCALLSRTRAVYHAHYVLAMVQGTTDDQQAAQRESMSPTSGERESTRAAPAEGQEHREPMPADDARGLLEGLVQKRKTSGPGGGGPAARPAAA